MMAENKLAPERHGNGKPDGADLCDPGGECDLAPPIMLHCESALDAEEQRGDVSS